MALKSYALTTVDRLAAFMGISPNPTQEAVLETIINAVTEYVENYCDRRFKQSTYTDEIYVGDGSKVIALRNAPVSSLSSFSTRNSALNENDWETVDSELYRLDTRTGEILGMGYEFRNGVNFRVTYVGGYDFNNSSIYLGDTEAGDVELAVWKLCASTYNQRRGNQGVTSERIGDYAVTFKKVAFADDEIKDILDRHTRLGVGGGTTPYLALSGW